MSIILCVHLKNDVFPISLPSPLHQGNPLSLTNAFTSLVNFLTGYKRLWRLCIVAGTSDSKNLELYYSLSLLFSSHRQPADVETLKITIFNTITNLQQVKATWKEEKRQKLCTLCFLSIVWDHWSRQIEPPSNMSYRSLFKRFLLKNNC